jgi:hypothetical protein
MGVTSVEDRRRNSPQADFTVLLPMNRIGLLLQPKVIAIHLIFSLNRFDPLVGASNRRKSEKTAHHRHILATHRTVPRRCSGHQSGAKKRTRPADPEPIHPKIATSLQFPPPELIERPEVAQVNVHAGIIPALM